MCGETFTHHRASGGKPAVTCSKKCLAKRSSETMAHTNRKHASQRMRDRNPMHRGDAKEKMKRTLKKMGHKPPVRGGTGTGMTVPQEKLLHLLGKGWKPEYVVPTKVERGNGWPTHYKLDLAFPSKKVCIEVDGASHGCLARREQDAKKTRFLSGLGWIVLRVSNREVLEEPGSTISRLKAAIRTSRTGS